MTWKTSPKGLVDWTIKYSRAKSTNSLSIRLMGAKDEPEVYVPCKGHAQVWVRD